ncbi:MAG: regulatory iron-sulfur-containing complex subunit RicT [Desulfurobacteriaceae bacterium]
MKVIKFKYPDTEKSGLAVGNKDINPSFNKKLIVQTDRGKEIVKVLDVYNLDEKSLKKFEVDLETVYKALREATDDDLQKFFENKLFAISALEVCKEKVEKHSLPMKLVKAYTTLNRERIVFYFTAESRVDFRQLVRDLAAHFKTRIELRQIGVRDEVKMIGAIGMCGRVCCCKDFLECFDSVSLTLARLQGLPPNPGKLSGACGRLMCCLKFEEANYYIKKFLPEVGEEIETVDGKGKVLDINIPLETLTVELEGGTRKHYPIRYFVSQEQWNEYINMLKEKKDDKFRCFSKQNVGINDEDSEEFTESTE